jgi:hypothetical protein
MAHVLHKNDCVVKGKQSDELSAEDKLNNKEAQQIQLSEQIDVIDNAVKSS